MSSTLTNDFNPSYVVVYTPSCNKDMDNIKLLGFWKTHTGAQNYLKNLVKVKKLEPHRHIMCNCCKEWYVTWKNDEDYDKCGCGCHLPSNGKYEECYSFESINYNKLLSIDLVHPNCGKHKFWIEKVSNISEFNDLMNAMRASIY